MRGNTCAMNVLQCPYLNTKRIKTMVLPTELPNAKSTEKNENKCEKTLLPISISQRFGAVVSKENYAYK